MFVIDNVKFCCQTKQKVLTQNTFGRMQTWNKKD